MAFKDFVRNKILNAPGKAKKTIEARGFAFDEPSFLTCIREGKLEEVKLFLEGGMNPNARGIDQVSAVQQAVASDRPAILDVLMAAGCDTTARDPEGNTLVMFAVLNGREAVGKLLARASAVDARNNGGYSAVMLCAQGNQVGIAEALINAGADVLGKNHISGETPLIMAAQRGYLEMVELLLKNAITSEDRDATDKKGCTALLRAAQNGHAAVLRLLCERKADVNLADSQGTTPLHAAAASGSAAVVQILLDSGAKKDSTDRQGKTPRQIAAEAGFTEIATILGS